MWFSLQIFKNSESGLIEVNEIMGLTPFGNGNKGWGPFRDPYTLPSSPYPIIDSAHFPKLIFQLFSGKGPMLACFVSDMIPISLLAVICVARHDVAKTLFFGYAFLTFAAYAVTFVSNSVVFRIVANHIRVVQSLQDRTRLLETRQVAIATLAQAVVPLVCQVSRGG